ncbi:hypothetical protein [Brevundimonas sp. 'scallop']|uniref:hypothetical protein n=1 Tax=Brevundimonas sp. 'scallop' TaxID=2562582 RepID=UPI0013E1F20E|nr:hypothetical protein [Brevundimonas sp. 'scallop']QIF82488.1 hypothetical protein E4341_12770 [Brevundimonas sp. 'scallop']
MSDGDEYEYDDRDGITCPRCQGDGTVDCHCGGDLCVCENYGERDCPVCGGDGEVSEMVEAQYEESRRQAYEAMRKVWPDPE